MIKQGFAKRAFAVRYSTTPWKRHSTPPLLWPALEKLVAENKLALSDYLLTHQLFRNANLSEDAALFLCHLLLATKDGHLCVHTDNGVLTPSIKQVWESREGVPLTETEADALTLKACQGVRYLLSSPLPNVHINEGNFYFKKFWDLETEVLSALVKHLTHPLTIQIDLDAVRNHVHALSQKGVLQLEQGEGILNGCRYPFSMMSGGPGTGKTYTAGQLIKILLSQLDDKQKENFEIVLAAPTGKAAANLHSSLQKTMGEETGTHFIKAATIHHLLGIKSKKHYRSPKPLTADLVIIDESSMLDMALGAALFRSIKPGSRLILLGDQHQLPAVEAGSLFADLIKASQSDISPPLPSIQLNRCLRTESPALINVAQAIKSGHQIEISAILKQQEEVHLIPLNAHIAKAQQTVIHSALDHFRHYDIATCDAVELLKLSQTFRLLSPLRHGPFGFHTLNELIWNLLSQQNPQTEWMAIPIIIASNDPREELYNGDTGILVRKVPFSTFSDQDYALFLGRGSEHTIKRLPASLLPNYEYAYCLSVHKSQGSEFDNVSLVLPEGASHMGREMLYTAITRTRKQIDIHSTNEILLKTIEYQAVRQSGITARLMQHSH